MRVSNDTRYSRAAIVRVVDAVLDALAAVEGPLPNRVHLRVELRNRRGCYLGWAPVGGAQTPAGCCIELRLETRGMAAGALVAIVEHEVLHLYGYSHGRPTRGGFRLRYTASDVEPRHVAIVTGAGLPETLTPGDTGWLHSSPRPPLSGAAPARSRAPKTRRTTR